MKIKTLLLTVAFLCLIAVTAKSQTSGKPAMKNFATTGMRDLKSQRVPADKESSAKLLIEKWQKSFAGAEIIRPKHLIMQSYDPYSQHWNNEIKQTFIYDSGIDEKEMIQEIFQDDVLTPYMRYVYTYNEQMIVQETEIYYWLDEKKSWDLMEKELSHTDQNGNYVLEALLSWNEEMQRWDTLSGVKAQYVYTALGQTLEKLVWNFDSFQTIWVPFLKEVFTYDVQNRVDEFITLYWDEFFNQFEPESKESYSYDSNGEWDEVLISFYYDSEWIPSEKVSDFQWYDFGAKKPLAYIVYLNFGDKNDWVQQVRRSYEYQPQIHEQTFMLEEVFGFDSEEWFPFYREINEYNDNFYPKKMTIEFFEQGEWVIFIGIANHPIMNQHGYPDEVMIEWFDGLESGEWVYFMNLIFEYEYILKVRPELEKQVLRVFPNPFSEYINVELAGITTGMRIEVYNASGQLVWHSAIDSESIGSHRINLSHLPKGVYYLKQESAERVNASKLIKQ